MLTRNEKLKIIVRYKRELDSEIWNLLIDEFQISKIFDLEDSQLDDFIIACRSFVRKI